jgi:hypothetical protein
MKIIAFSGKSSAGKSTAAGYLSRTYGFHVSSFAARLKDLAATFYPFTYPDLYGSQRNKPYKEYTWTPREFLVTLGHFCRFFDKDYFVKNLNEDGYTKIAIDDLRFKNEAEALKTRGATLIRIERYEKYLTTSADQSETDLDDYKGFDYTINTVENRSLQAFYDRLEEIMEKVNGTK